MNIPIDNTALIDAVSRLKEKTTQENRLWFLQKLINSKFILPVVIIPEPVNNKIPADATVNYFSMRTSKGLVYLAVFTSGEEYEKWNKNPNKMYLIRSYDDIKKLVMSVKDYDGFVIDPCGCNMAIQKSLIQNIEKAANPEVVIKPEKIQTEGNIGLKPFENPPKELVNTLYNYFEDQNNVSKAYLMQTIRKGKIKLLPFLLWSFVRTAV